MYHIYLYTPPLRHSHFYAHLLEHAVLGPVQSAKEFFRSRSISWETYTYFTNFTINSSSREDVDLFIKHIQLPPCSSTIRFEHKVIREELANKGYHTSLIHRIWCALYGPSVRYSQVSKIRLDDVLDYHNKYYSRGSIYVLEDAQKECDIAPSLTSYSQTFILSHRGIREKIYITDNTPSNLIANNLLQDLFDAYIEYQRRYQQGNYYWNDTLAGEFEQHAFIAYDKTYEPYIREIPAEFILQYSEHRIQEGPNWDYWNDIDWALLVQHGYRLTLACKERFLRNIDQIYQHFIKTTGA